MSALRTPLAAALEGTRAVSDLGVDVAADYGDAVAEYEALRGDAGLADRSGRAPVLVTQTDWIAADAGLYHSVALRS